MVEKTALVAFNSGAERNKFDVWLDIVGGYHVKQVSSIDELLKALGIPQGSPPESLPTVQVESYVVMDLDFGDPNPLSHGSALEVYERLKGYNFLRKNEMKKKTGRVIPEIRFMAFGDNLETVLNAKKVGIPCRQKTKENYNKFLEELNQQPRPYV